MPLASSLAACLFVLGAIGVALAPWRTNARAAVAVGLVALASLCRRLFARRDAPSGWLVVDETGIRRVRTGGDAHLLVGWTEPFGVTVHASPDRSRFLVSLTTPRATRFVSVQASNRADLDAAPTLIERATTAAESDLRVDPDMALTASDAEVLLGAIARRAPAAFDRLYVCGAAGEPVVLQTGELTIGRFRIDLSTPLEWRATIFQERGAAVASVCQATWVRQGDSEVVFVAQLPGDAPWLRRQEPVEGPPVGLARDLRLMQAPIGDPPPRELRCAIDRLFMIPLRRVLDGAPRAEPQRPTRGRSPRASHP